MLVVIPIWVGKTSRAATYKNCKTKHHGYYANATIRKSDYVRYTGRINERELEKNVGCSCIKDDHFIRKQITGVEHRDKLTAFWKVIRKEGVSWLCAGHKARVTVGLMWCERVIYVFETKVVKPSLGLILSTISILSSDMHLSYV